MLMPLLDTVFRIYVLQQEFELQLPFDCVYPFDPTQNWLTYLAIYILQMYSSKIRVFFYNYVHFTKFTFVNIHIHAY